jgi:beta-N-acetylhexosaminidase
VPATYQPVDHLVALSGDEIVGFVATQLSPRQGHEQSALAHGHLVALFVDPAYQRQGIGRALHDRALDALGKRRVAEMHLGRGDIYFWQGVPTNLPVAWQFFQTYGWAEQARSFDLVTDLAGYATPPGTYERVPRGVMIGQATRSDGAEVMDFEQRHFPGWLASYHRILDHERASDVVVARDAREGIVGTSAVMDPHALWWRQDSRWLHLIGERTGAVGPLGVAEAQRGQGIGLAIATRVTELLRERGFAHTYVGWTWLVD